MQNPSVHTFHIPVLGLCFSIDTPLKVARFGIDSVVSIIEDDLIEHMRVHHASKNNIPFPPIADTEPDYRAKRITAYLNLLHLLVQKQVEEMRHMDFSEGSDLSKYFEMLPTSSSIRDLYLRMDKEEDQDKKLAMQEQLRTMVVPGSIDVNIMAKVDNPRYGKDGVKLPDEFSDALSALRGFALSDLHSSIVFSAGYNPRLYNYAAQFADFLPDACGMLRKKIILKVSDYRSALVQGKTLAKKGLWVSEFRVESGLNCGGHAFATEGLLMGPILEEFSRNRNELHKELWQLCNKSLEAAGRPMLPADVRQKLTAQGGIGTATEQEFLLSHYNLDATGWGSPFLLVPEATNVDETTLQELAKAKKEDYYLSEASPLGVPFNNFRKSTSEAQRKQRIAKGRPGSPCYLNYLASDTEFTDKPICTASRQYQHLKIKQLEEQNLDAEQLDAAIAKLESKDCLCEGLTASVRLKNDMYLPHKMSAVAICPGPNLAYFSGIFTLKQMCDHIYGRVCLNNSLERPHMFLNELQIYADYLKKQIAETTAEITAKQIKHFRTFRENLLAALDSYRTLLAPLPNRSCNEAHMARLQGVLLRVNTAFKLSSANELSPAI